MGDTLQAVHATLRDEAGPQPAPPARDERARLLLRRLKSAAYDIEDMLEEFAARNHRQGGRSRAGEGHGYELERLIDFLNVGAKGSKILVTTRYEQIALKMNPILCYRLEGLSDEECWDLFKKRAFRSDAKETKLEQIGREIVK